MPVSVPALKSACPAAASRIYYGWIVLLVAAAAMVGTLPGRTQGLGLITEPLLADLGIEPRPLRGAELLGHDRRVGGRDRRRAADRSVRQPRRPDAVALALGVVVCAMSQRRRSRRWRCG